MDVSGKITSATPNKQLYQVGDEVWLNVSAYAIYHPDHDWSLWWNVYYEVKNLRGQIVASEVRSETIAFWTTEDRADHKLSFKCGRFLESDILTVTAEFQSIGFPWGMGILIDDRKVEVWVREAAVPVPPPSPTPVVPMPVPSPSPLPVPSPSPTPPPEGPAAEDAQSPWLWVGLAALGLVLLAPKGKVGKG